MVGNFVMSIASQLVASIDDHDVTSIISKVVDDLVKGDSYITSYYYNSI